jgi:UDPglucose 6-dehydrogenase
MRIIISGYGYVGKATELVLQSFCKPLTGLEVQDPPLGRAALGWDDAAFHIVCVPTPSINDDSGTPAHDMSIVRTAILHANHSGFKGRTVIRSTMSPKDLANIITEFDDVIYWPEFLREATWQDDAINPIVSVMGGTHASELYVALMPYCRSYMATAVSACMVKLTINSILAMQTIVGHDVKKACDAMDIDSHEVWEFVKHDPRIGKGHFTQPGPDGKWGFGGNCLPKDTAAMAHLLSDINVTSNYAEYATMRNKSIRP